jgi:TolB-like protein
MAAPAAKMALEIAYTDSACQCPMNGSEPGFFSDGMTEEITAALAKVKSPHMGGCSSAFQFKRQSRDLRAIRQSLGATYLIDGSVRREGDRVRIAAKLVQASNGVSLWTESYDRQLTSVFATQEDIAQAITVALKVPLGLHESDS